MRVLDAILSDSLGCVDFDGGSSIPPRCYALSRIRFVRRPHDHRREVVARTGTQPFIATFHLLRNSDGLDFSLLSMGLEFPAMASAGLGDFLVPKWTDELTPIGVVADA